MKTATAIKLNQLNQHFYKKVAEHFHTSRQFYWHGWRQLLPHIKNNLNSKTQLKVLDVGCGNGRFGKFLFDTLPEQDIIYHGIDFNQSLLEHAQQNLKKTTLTFELHQLDLVEKLISDTLFSTKVKKYDLIVLFGVLHHIPSYQLRKQLVQNLSAQVAETGILCCTLWRFINPDNEKSTATVDSSQVNIDQNELEPHDYFIPWKRGVPAIRYCHFTPDFEERRLITASGLKLRATFEADGKESKGNRYLILQNDNER
ncbi:MAG: class I SAM-dependent methyltransferase [Patescibacteria group bacterium]